MSRSGVRPKRDQRIEERRRNPDWCQHWAVCVLDTTTEREARKAGRGLGSKASSARAKGVVRQKAMWHRG